MRFQTVCVYDDDDDFSKKMIKEKKKFRQVRRQRGLRAIIYMCCEGLKH